MTLWSVAKRFRWRVAFTSSLVVVEAVIELLLPLFIGIAINGLLDDDRTGLWWLAALGTAELVIGSLRRFVDTRAYTGMYETLAGELVEREQANDTPTSTVAARTHLLTEVVEFLEDSLPQVVTATLGTVGILVIIGGLDPQVLLACLGLLVLVALTYWASAARNLRLHGGYNDELERQVVVLDDGDRGRTGQHFRRLMRWNRQLSDLETINYAIVWAGVIALLIYAPIEVVEPGVTEYGFAFSTILYVFQYIEGLVTLPLHIQQLIRLKEISTRLSGERPVDGDDDRADAPQHWVPPSTE
ncbi:MAG: ABC transporter six-transmembrane domain-containing protein [Actinomycetota bacterium]